MFIDLKFYSASSFCHNKHSSFAFFYNNDNNNNNDDDDDDDPEMSIVGVGKNS